MDNNNSQRPHRRVSRKVIRQRQLTALAVIALIVLLLVVLVAKGCSNTDSKKKGDSKGNTQTSTEPTEPSTEDISDLFPTVTEPTTDPEPTIDQALTAQVQLSKRQIFLQVGETDVSIINQYPDGSYEANEVWESSDPSIATVDDLGHVTGVANGECYVLLTFDNNPGVRIEIKVTVAGGTTT